jgi:hypothetical protein
MKRKRILKKQILRLQYLETEYEDCLEIHDEAKCEFESAVRKLHYNLNVFDDDLDQKTPTPASDADPDTNKKEADAPKEKKDSPPAWAKNLFRKIVKRTHPDKLAENLDKDTKERFKELYQEAKESIDRGDFVKIAMIANDLNMDLRSIEIKDFHTFREKETALQEKIKKVKSSMFWAWATSTGEQKDKIMQEFLKLKGWTSPQALRKKSRKGKHPGQSIAWARTTSLKKDDEK